MIVEFALFAAAFLVIVGSAFAFVAALGVLRFPDVYTRMHAASKAGVVGAGFILLAIAFAAFDVAIILRALLGIGFLLLTTPVSTHLLARAAAHSRHKLVDYSVVDDLSSESKTEL